MSILVTGGTGTLGFQLLSVVTSSKGTLTSFSDDLPTPYRTSNLVNYEKGNLLNFKEVTEILQKHTAANPWNAEI